MGAKKGMDCRTGSIEERKGEQNSPKKRNMNSVNME